MQVGWVFKVTMCCMSVPSWRLPEAGAEYNMCPEALLWEYNDWGTPTDSQDENRNSSLISHSQQAWRTLFISWSVVTTPGPAPLCPLCHQLPSCAQNQGTILAPALNPQCIPVNLLSSPSFDGSSEALRMSLPGDPSLFSLS